MKQITRIIFEILTFGKKQRYNLPMKIQLIGVDLDGTLLTSQKRITERTKQALSAAIAKGITVVPVTGRPAAGLPSALLSIEGIRYAITADGSVVQDLASGSVLESRSLSCQNALYVLETVGDTAPAFEAFTGGFGYEEEHSLAYMTKINAGTGYMDYILKTRKTIPDMRAFLENTASVDFLSIRFADAALAEKYCSVLSENPELYVVVMDKYFLEVTDRSANKGDALLFLADYLSIPHAEVMAIGDSGNDYSLLSKAGYSVAMGNASEAIKAIADTVTASNEEDGVALILERLALV